MHVLIVDDEMLARQRLVRIMKEIDGYDVVGDAENGDQALALIEEHDPDIVLLDIRMPGDDGLTVARNISALNDPPALIFCTAYDEYAVEAFETLAVGYLVKPIRREQLIAALEKVNKLNKVQKGATQTADSNQRQNISAKTRKGLELIPVDEVHCFVADHKYVTVIHGGGETLIDDTLKDLEQEFEGRFVRVHRNSLVAIKEIERMERAGSGQYEIKLKHANYRPVVSRRHVSSVRELLTHL